MFRYFVAKTGHKQRKSMVYAKIKVTNFSRDRCIFCISAFLHFCIFCISAFSAFLHFCISAFSAALAVFSLVPAGAPGARLVKREQVHKIIYKNACT